ncbi:MAG: hypothetical protein JO030_07850 [Candidatus Eremiobacteraeota bacterium]|nr:hypothetical protein [Candidatus Eremiobacteraeota bacterium]
MKTLRAVLRGIAVFGAIVVLVRCGSDGALTPLQHAYPALTDKIFVPRGSWMLPEARRSDLLYVANDGSSNDVTVYSYPSGKLVGVLTGFNHPTGLCVDKVGDVYVANFYGESVVEYRHGGKDPIETLADNGTPNGCAIDPTTGNLAVTNNCDGPVGSCFPSGTVLIYTRAKGKPHVFTDQYTVEMLYCVFDKAGNLFVDGINGFYHIGFAELRKGKAVFSSIDLKLPLRVTQPGGLQWAGHLLTVAPGNGRAIYQYTLSGSRATLVRTVALMGIRNIFGTNQFRIERSTVVAPVLSTKEHPNGVVEYFRYPSGGDAFYAITRSIDTPEAADVSLH